MNKYLSTLLVVYLAFTNVVSADTENIIAFDKSEAKYRVGEIFSLDIIATNLTISEGGGINLEYDASIIHVVEVSIDTGAWSLGSQIGDIDNNAGIVRDILFSSFKGALGNVKIAKVLFQAIGKGKSSIVITESAKNPFASSGQRMTVNFSPVDIHVIRAR
ncbi:MAG: cohesin domain-containing protein [Gammaproteobacteria bacterium]|nr:cohesin domain-containing protein [Gammaproteobacteria bacterium]